MTAAIGQWVTFNDGKKPIGPVVVIGLGLQSVIVRMQDQYGNTHSLREVPEGDITEAR